MNTIILVIGIVTWIIGEIILCKKLNNKFYFIVMLIFTISICCIILYTSKYCMNIGALDVYRNNTELKVKYEVINNDTISCDSIVVFK